MSYAKWEVRTRRAPQQRKAVVYLETHVDADQQTMSDLRAKRARLTNQPNLRKESLTSLRVFGVTGWLLPADLRAAVPCLVRSFEPAL
eukprot:6175708-Pleurochrysis_carterae.AAC.2